MKNSNIFLINLAANLHSWGEMFKNNPRGFWENKNQGFWKKPQCYKSLSDIVQLPLIGPKKACVIFGLFILRHWRVEFND